MERVIGYMGSLLKQPSNPFRNFAAQTRRVATTNALIAMWPEFEKPKDAPRGSKDLGDGFLLLGPKDTTLYRPSSPSEQRAIGVLSSDSGDDENTSSIYRWGCLKIPSEQIARSRWKEMERCSDMARTDRNVKVRDSIKFKIYHRLLNVPQISHHGVIHFAEVMFFFTKTVGGEAGAFALVSKFSRPNDYLLSSTQDTLIVCRHQGEEGLVVVDAKSILSVVAMVPFRYAVDGLNNYYFVIEQIGLDIVEVDTQEGEGET
jgi:hypothetical protein